MNERASASSGAVTTLSESAAVGPHTTFAALDSAGSSVPATWTQASSRSAEAGYQDPSLGWVAVRAQQDANGVHATLVPGSANAAQSLGAHMNGLSHYLSERNAPVQTLSMAAPTGQDTAFTQGHGSGQPAGQQADRHTGSSAVNGADDVVLPSAAGPGGVSEAYRPAGGTYVSVMA